MPAATRTLTYGANVQQTGTFNTLFIMTLSGNVTFGNALITGGIIGQELKFGTFNISESTTGGGIAVIGNATAIVAADGTITGTISGVFQTPSGSTCASSAHQLKLVKK